MEEYFENMDELTYHDNWWTYCTAPLKEQVEVVNKITQVLNITFPVSSKQYSRASYAWFIRNFAEQFKRKEKEWLETHDYISDLERLT